MSHKGLWVFLREDLSNLLPNFHKSILSDRCGVIFCVPQISPSEGKGIWGCFCQPLVVNIKLSQVFCYEYCPADIITTAIPTTKFRYQALGELKESNAKSGQQVLCHWQYLNLLSLLHPGKFHLDPIVTDFNAISTQMPQFTVTVSFKC